MPIRISVGICAFLVAGAAIAIAAPGFAQPAPGTANTRWVIGSPVNLRAQASTSAPVVMRLRYGTPVTLLGPASESSVGGVAFCEVQTQVTAQRGFAACEYLASKPPAGGQAATAVAPRSPSVELPAAAAVPAPPPVAITPPARPTSAPAGAASATAATAPEPRWINASGVNLRDQASTRASVLARLSRNAPVQLIAAQPDGVFCEVVTQNEVTAAQRGFVACQYLGVREADVRGVVGVADARTTQTPGTTDRPAAATTPLPDAASPKPGSTPASSASALERAFWQDPTPMRLFVYGKYLEQSRLSSDQKASEQDARPVEFVARPEPILQRPKVREFETMKARLAQGVVGTTPPAPLLAWRDLQKAFAAAETDIAQARKTSKLQARRDQPWQYLQPGQTAFEAKLAGLVSTSAAAARRPAKGADVSASAPSPLSARVAGLALVMDKIELPPVTPSFFKNWADIAPPSATVPELSAKWGMPYTLETQPGPRWVSNRRNGTSQIAGSWDVGRAVVQLTSPVVRLSVARDGQVVAGVSGLNSVVLDDKDAFGGCQLGFRYGDAGVDLLNPNVNYSPQDIKSANPTLIRLFLRNPAASLSTNASVKSTPVTTLSEPETGFTAAEQLSIDLDGDGVPDLAVWEATGQPHDSIYTPQRQDPYFRVYAINLAGAWYLLGRDEFVYGCG